ncbi:DUF2298 domain-containing protein [Patescibacteria group bacterium]
MTNNFFIIFYWWLLLFGLGIAFLPLTTYLFHRFFDRGYAFSKILAILIVAYLTWLTGSLKILPFSVPTLWMIIALTSLCFFLLLKKQRQALKNIKVLHLKIFLGEEFLFLVALFAWSFVRGFQPNIQGLEKFMDHGFVNSILRSRFFPPADMWLAGETINYYYFGHLISAVLTKLSGLNSAITYNLMIATIFALSFGAAFSLGGNLINIAKQELAKIRKKRLANWRQIVLGGLLAALLLTLSGNLHLLWSYFDKGSLKSYWYPDATRFIVDKFGANDNTIHEFPIYSFVVADLHGHMINLPNVLLILALIITLTLSIKKKKTSSRSYFLLLALSLCLAIAFMTNAWDYPIYLLIAGGNLLLFNFMKYRFDWKKLILQTIIPCGLLVFTSLIFLTPFLLFFENIAQGVASVDFRSPLRMLLVLWGFPIIISLCFLAYLFWTIKKKKKILSTDLFTLVALAVSWALIIFPELFYVKDIYIHTHQRANTMFKLTYQSFVMFHLVAGYVILRILLALKNKGLKILMILLALPLISSLLLYSRFAIRSYYGLQKQRGLYGLNHLKEQYPDDYQGILWLENNFPGQPVIVEAVGESYTDFARVSANTGLPTILGWRVHEWLWRGSFDEPSKRTEEVKTIYESTDRQKTQEILNQYQVELIFLGTLEKQQYPLLQEEKLAQLGKLVFSSGETKIYQIKNNI